MANSAAILQKLARNAAMLGLTVNSQSRTAVVIDNGSNDLTISYVDASFDPSVVGGVASTSSPFLGIGVGNPGKIKIKSSSTAADAISDVLDSLVAAKVLVMVSAMANDIVLENSDATYSQSIRVNADLIGLGE